MFDARSILDAIIAGSSEQTRNARESGGLNDIMGDLLSQLQKVGGADTAAPAGRLEREGGFRAEQRKGEAESTGRSRNPLDDLFGQLGGTSGQPRSRGANQGRDPGGDPDAGHGRHQRYEDGPASGRGEPGYGDLLDRVKDLVANNKTAAGAIVGGLGGLLLGTRTGRSLAGRAVRLGGLALIGTLAYRAYRNYQKGAPVPADRPDRENFDMPQLPPEGSGFEADGMSNDDAALFIRTMVAAAAADGRIDQDEQRRILGNLEQAGLQDEAMEFLAGEFNNPAGIEDIVNAVNSPEQAAKVYAAARIAIEPDTREEQEFLSQLSQRLDLDSALAAHIDATAAAIKVR